MTTLFATFATISKMEIQQHRRISEKIFDKIIGIQNHHFSPFARRSYLTTASIINTVTSSTMPTKVTCNTQENDETLTSENFEGNHK